MTDGTEPAFVLDLHRGPVLGLRDAQPAALDGGPLDHHVRGAVLTAVAPVLAVVEVPQIARL